MNFKLNILTINNTFIHIYTVNHATFREENTLIFPDIPPLRVSFFPLFATPGMSTAQNTMNRKHMDSNTEHFSLYALNTVYSFSWCSFVSLASSTEVSDSSIQCLIFILSLLAAPYTGQRCVSVCASVCVLNLRRVWGCLSAGQSWPCAEPQQEICSGSVCCRS